MQEPSGKTISRLARSADGTTESIRLQLLWINLPGNSDALADFLFFLKKWGEEITVRPCERSEHVWDYQSLCEFMQARKASAKALETRTTKREAKANLASHKERYGSQHIPHSWEVDCHSVSCQIAFLVWCDNRAIETMDVLNCGVGKNATGTGGGEGYRRKVAPMPVDRKGMEAYQRETGRAYAGLPKPLLAETKEETRDIGEQLEALKTAFRECRITPAEFAGEWRALTGKAPPSEA